MVRSTLAQILERLPLLLRNRYGGNADRFWVNKYNDLLGELERSKTGPKNVMMVPVPWQTISSKEVLLPHGLSEITRAYKSTGGEVRFDPNTNGMRLLDSIPSASQIITIAQLNGRRSRFGRDILQMSATPPQPEIGDAIVIHPSLGSSQANEYNPPSLPAASWVISQMPAPEVMGFEGTSVSIPMEDGEYDWPINAATDFYWIFRDFLIVEGYRAYHRIAASAERTSLPPEWDSMVEAYLRFKGEVQTDQSSKDSQDWAALWVTEQRKWLGHQSHRPASAATKTKRPGLSFSARR